MPMYEKALSFALRDARPYQSLRPQRRGRQPERPIDRRIRELNRRLRNRSPYEESIFDEGETAPEGLGTL